MYHRSHQADFRIRLARPREVENCAFVDRVHNAAYCGHGDLVIFYRTIHSRGSWMRRISWLAIGFGVALAWTSIVVSARGGGGGGHSGGARSSGHSAGGHSSHSSSPGASTPSRSHSAISPGTGPNSSSTNVRGYTRKDGTYVAPSKRSTVDRNFNNNWSTKGNSNPYTGKEGSRAAPPKKTAVR